MKKISGMFISCALLALMPLLASAQETAATMDATAGAVAVDVEPGQYPGWPQYPGRRSYGLGYPYADQEAYPYRGRGAGYGPGRRGGYGYGYPGYRGRGGSGYPGHRQYGNPPFYQTDEAATD